MDKNKQRRDCKGPRVQLQDLGVMRRFFVLAFSGVRVLGQALNDETALLTARSQTHKPPYLFFATA